MIRVSPQRVVVFVLLLVLAASAQAQERAQEPASGTTFSESVDVRVAEVEVLVTDRDGKPVSGLTPADFQVVEDGQPREVTNLYTTSSQPLVLAVFFDDMSLGTGSRVAALKGLRSLFASNLKPGDRVLFVRFNGALEIQGEPTGDPAALQAILDRIGKSVSGGLMIQQERSTIQREILQGTPPGSEPELMAFAEGQAATLIANLRQYGRRRGDEVRATIAALQQTVALLSSLPERKALMLIGGGLPMNPGEDLFELWHEKYSLFENQLGVTRLETLTWDASRAVQETVDRANAAGVTLHAIAMPEGGPGGVAGAPMAVRSAWDPENSDLAVRTLAGATGGRVMTDLQNPAAFLELVGRDIGSTYVIGYTPTPAGKKARHKIKVSVRDGALAARYREERFDGAGGDPLLRRAMSTLWAGGGSNALQAELSIEEQTKEEDGRFRVTAIVSLPLAAVLLRPQEHFHVAHLTLAIVARDGKGQITGAPRAEFPIEIPNEKLLSAPGQSAGYRFTMRLSPGESIVAVALRDDMSGAESVLRIPVTAGAEAAAK
jgi:VWFA-related protein